jgi:hypothetical protein
VGLEVPPSLLALDGSTFSSVQEKEAARTNNNNAMVNNFFIRFFRLLVGVKYY